MSHRIILEPETGTDENRIRLQLPHNWAPRHYQEKLWNHLMDGGKRAIAIWPRRTGKDDVALHFTACAAQQKVANYWHCLPEYSQGRKAIWTAVNPLTGMRRIDEAFPEILRETTNDNEMFIRFTNGSTWQVVGSDVASQRLVGTASAGIVFSEWALSNPSSWGYLRPILEENNGWALFISTPRGHNHCKDMYDMALQHEQWFAERINIHDTGTMDEARLIETLNEYTALYGIDYGTAQFQQEYMTSFNAGVLGAMYAREMQQVRDEGRILEVDADPNRTVHRAWDLGVDDDTSIWWFQTTAAGQILLLDVYSASGVGLEHYVDVIKQREQEHGWKMGMEYVPHDAKIKEWGSGRTRVETMQRLRLRPVLVPLASLQDGINAVRRTLPLCVFHPRCQHGIAALEQYRREWNDETKSFKQSAVHDWTSHPCDAFRYMSMAWRMQFPKLGKPKTQIGITIPPPMEPWMRRGQIEL